MVSSFEPSFTLSPSLFISSCHSSGVRYPFRVSSSFTDESLPPVAMISFTSLMLRSGKSGSEDCTVLHLKSSGVSRYSGGTDATRANSSLFCQNVSRMLWRASFVTPSGGREPTSAALPRRANVHATTSSFLPAKVPFMPSASVDMPNRTRPVRLRLAQSASRASRRRPIFVSSSERGAYL